MRKMKNVGSKMMALCMLLAAGACAKEGSKAASPNSSADQHPTALPAGFVAGPSGKLRVDDGGAGDGVPVIFVHGLGADHHVWDEAIAHVRPGRRALAVDLHGFGESAPSATGDYSIDSMVADLLAVADAEKLPRVILVGHSYGSQVIGAFAGRYPDRVAGLLLVDPTPDFSGAGPDDLASVEQSFVANKTKQWQGMLKNAAPGVSDRVLHLLDATPPAVFQGTLHGMLAYDPKPAFQKYAGPKLAIINEGMADLPIALHKVVAGLDVKIMKGVSHWLMLDKPDEFAGYMDAFLASVK